jgi:hypothetical protein
MLRDVQKTLSDGRSVGMAAVLHCRRDAFLAGVVQFVVVARVPMARAMVENPTGRRSAPSPPAPGEA